MEFSVRTKRELKIWLLFVVFAIVRTVVEHFTDQDPIPFKIWMCIIAAQSLRTMFTIYEHRVCQRELQERREDAEDIASIADRKDEPTIAFVEIVNKS
jgi:hypothetical protein